MKIGIGCITEDTNRMGIEERMSEADEWKKLYFELKSVAIALEQQRDAFREENERLRKDAERYEYIRCGRRTTAIYEYIRGERLLKLDDELDAAIDAAKEAE